MTDDTKPSARQTNSSPRQTNSLRQVLDHPGLMLVLLFLVTLFLGLPFLWNSRAFSVPMKVAVSIATLAWSAIVFWVFWLIMAWSYQRIFPN